jgi:hypothetical protein
LKVHLKALSSFRAHILIGATTQAHPLPPMLGATRLHRLIPPSRLTQASERPNRIVSGSFGSFGGEVNRFDERAYRLGPRKEEDEVKREVKKAKKADGKPDLFKGMPWLR